MCIPVSAIGDTAVENAQLSHFMSSIGGCNHLTQLPTKLPSSKYLASVGYGKNCRLSIISTGHAFNLNENPKIHPVNIFALPSLSNPRVDDLFAIIYSKSTSFMRMLQNGNHMSFNGVTDTPFKLDEASLQIGYHKGVYIQITPTTVRAVTSTECLGSWSTAGDELIEKCCIGKNFIILVRKKYSIKCLRWEENEFKPLEEFHAKSEITCVMEYDSCILVGSINRSICVYTIDNYSLTEAFTLPIDSNPRSLFSFSSITNTAFSPYTLSSDSTIFVGCDEGNLVLIAPKQGTTDLEIIKTTLIDPTRASISLSFTIFNKTPALFVLANSVSYIVYQNRAMDFIPVLFEWDRASGLNEGSSHSTNPLSYAFLTFKNGESRDVSFLMKKNMLYTLKGDMYLPGGSYFFSPNHMTCRSIHSTQNDIEVVSGDTYVNDPQVGTQTMNTIQVFSSSEYRLSSAINYSCPEFQTASVTAVVMMPEMTPDQERKVYCAFGTMDSNAKYFIHYGLCDKPGLRSSMS